MYRAKASGKNRYEVYAEDVLQNPTKYLELENEINRAIEEDQFILHYQPEISIATSRMVGAEALVRWRHPERGLLLPKDFVPVAEESGLIFAIERWVLREACAQLAAWGNDALSMSVNVSARQLGSTDLVDVVRAALEDSGVAPRRLCLEITETAMMADPAAIGAEWLRKTALREARIRETLQARLPAACVDLDFGEVSTDWRGAVRRLYRALGMILTPDVEARMTALAGRKARHLGHDYRLETFGLDRSAVTAAMSS